MKQILPMLFLAAASAMAQTGDVAQVINVQPRIVTVNQRQCQQQEVGVNNSSSDGAIGALAGAALGSTVGGNNRDRLAGGVVGALIGGVVGNNVGQQSAHTEVREVCRIVPISMQQGSIVTFSYHGVLFTQQFAQ